MSLTILLNFSFYLFLICPLVLFDLYLISIWFHFGRKSLFTSSIPPFRLQISRQHTFFSDYRANRLGRKLTGIDRGLIDLSRGLTGLVGLERALVGVNRALVGVTGRQG